MEKNIINIDCPCVQDVVIRKNETDLCFTTVDGQDETKLFLKDDEDVQLTINFGDISNIGFGGTDNWGKDRLPLYVDYKKDSQDHDGVFVDTIKIQEYAGDGNWCKCELVNNNSAVRYTALAENPYNAQRIAYFYHSTDDDTVKRGYNVGRPAKKTWCVTVIQEANPNGDIKPTEDKIGFKELIDLFNTKLSVPVKENTKTWNYLMSGYNTAEDEWDNGTNGLFDPDNFPEIYNGSDYRGTNDKYETDGTSFNAMQAWLMAMELSELVLSYSAGGKTSTNNQTNLFQKAYEIGGGASVGLYGGYTVKGDPMIARLVASAVYTLNRKDRSFSDMNVFRNEICGNYINISGSFTGLDFVNSNPVWDVIGCKVSSTKVPSQVIPNFNDTQRRSLDVLGYAVNTQLFLPNTPGPKVSGTNASDNPHPSTQGQDISLFNLSTGNYYVDENADSYMTTNYNMMDATKVNDWYGYSKDKKERLLQVAATPGCTRMFMFWPESKVTFKGIENYSYRDVNYDIFRFDADPNGDLTLTGPFSMHSGICHYINSTDITVIERSKTPAEHYMDCLTEVADNLRFPMYCEQYGRRRPGGADNLNGHPGRGGCPGSYLNEIYNMDINQMVADDRRGTEKSGRGHEDGDAADSPTSYPSGHSSQIWALAMALASIKPENIKTYMRNSYMYSVNRSIGRFHWNSDCIYGRLFGTMTLPIVNAINIMEEGYNYLKSAINDEPVPVSDVNINVTIKNNSDKTLTLNGEMCLVLANPDVNGNYYGWQGCYNRTGHIKFSDPVSIQPNTQKTFNNVNTKNSEIEVGGRNPLDPSKLSEAKRPSNVLLYDTNGVSETFVPQCLDPSIIFKEGGSYTIIVGDGGGDEGDWKVNLYINNQTGNEIKSTGEVRLYIGNHDTGINTYLPGAAVTAGALYTFGKGMNDLTKYDIHASVNGGTINDSYNGKVLDSEARIYDYRHWNSSDCGWNVILDTSDPRCDSTLKKSGATYVLKITNK